MEIHMYQSTHGYYEDTHLPHVYTLIPWTYSHLPEWCYGDDNKHRSIQSQCKRHKKSVLASLTFFIRTCLRLMMKKLNLFSSINPQQARFVMEASITLSGAAIKATKMVRNLGVMMNTHLDASDQVSAIGRSCNYHLRRIAQVRQYISEEACKLAVLALVISHLDYCNGLLAGATEQMYDKLQWIQTVLRGWWLDSGWPTAKLYTSCRSYSGFTGSLSGSVLSTNSVCRSSSVRMGLHRHTSWNFCIFTPGIGGSGRRRFSS